MIAVSLLLNLACFPQLYKLRTNTPFSFGTALDAVAQGIVDPGTRYVQRFKQVAGPTGTTPLEYATLLLYPALWILFPLAVVQWHRLSIPLKIGFVIWVICDLLTWIAAGTNKGLADFLMLLPWLLIARNPSVLAAVSWRKVLTIGLFVLIGCSAFLVFFGARWGSHRVALLDSASGASVEAKDSYFGSLPEAFRRTLIGTTSYFTQGYYALGLSLQKPFVFCYGVGNSYLWEGLSRKFVDTRILDRTYPGRIRSQGWDPYIRWHSFYTWIASDVSFYGTIVVMFLVGRLFALVWREVVFNRGPWAICLFPLLLMMLYYIPANNQVLAFPGTALPFWSLLFAWFYSRVGGRRTPRRGV